MFIIKVKSQVAFKNNYNNESGFIIIEKKEVFKEFFIYYQ